MCGKHDVQCFINGNLTKGRANEIPEMDAVGVVVAGDVAESLPTWWYCCSLVWLQLHCGYTHIRYHQESHGISHRHSSKSFIFDLERMRLIGWLKRFQTCIIFEQK